MNSYFFDTYPFFEIMRGNPSYAMYKGCMAVTTLFHLAELNYKLKMELDVKTADKVTESYRQFLVDVSLEDVKSAMTFRIKHKGMSVPDVVGYVVAKRLGIKFLTGDEHFRALPNVEFVK